MQFSRRHFVIAGSTAAALHGAPAWAEVSPDTVQAAARFVDELAGKAMAVLRRNQGSLEQREAALRAILAKDFDLPFIGRFVMGRHWRRANAEQRAEYQAVFSQWLLQTYARRLGGYSNETFHVTGARPAGKKDTMVQTRINRPSGPPIIADWRVRARNGQFRIIDIMVEGISMAVTQRSDFGAVINRRGIAGLLQVLRARTEKYAVSS